MAITHAAERGYAERKSSTSILTAACSRITLAGNSFNGIQLQFFYSYGTKSLYEESV
jgi:hypothetical protein